MSFFGKIVGGAVALAAAYLLVTMYGEARYVAGQLNERTNWQNERVEGERARMQAYQDGLGKRQAAEKVYVETIRQLPPVTNTIIERTAQYAATPAGARECLAAERVLGIVQTRGALFPGSDAGAAGSGQGAVPAQAPRAKP